MNMQEPQRAYQEKGLNVEHQADETALTLSSRRRLCTQLAISMDMDIYVRIEGGGGATSGTSLPYSPYFWRNNKLLMRARRNQSQPGRPNSHRMQKGGGERASLKFNYSPHTAQKSFPELYEGAKINFLVRSALKNWSRAPERCHSNIIIRRRES
jgi:hypothetical protein